ncbi:hypothetical protein Taro_046206 [Colocasia esculenta]|uniref:Pectinesterase n=1 Tax=Colocasia esculenta TaxID=4460 RepID=A0A843WT64_COLES|nr:hypothetical protein [Colocasia esculenta]
MMPSSHPPTASIFLLFLCFFTPSLSDTPPSVPISPDGACSCTTYPDFCKSILQKSGPANLYNYGRFSLSHSLWNARRFLGMVNWHLARRSTLSGSAVRALEDCQLLMELNVDFLRSAEETLGQATTSLPNPTADQVQTILSALLTNQQTCLEGLEATASAWSVNDVLDVPLSNGTKMYSVSLALVTRAWIPKKRRGALFGRFVRDRIPRVKRWGWRPRKITRKLLFHEAQIGRDGSLPLRMSDRNRQLFESKTGRKLLQSPSSSGQIVVSDIVVVSKNRTAGNFTTIAAAISSAPNNTGVSNGYYLIYVAAGLYQEYLVVPVNKKYLMMVGDGINQTVITGNHSMGDGWTTFNSATIAVVGQGFVAVDMTIRNTAGAIKGQAVAVRNGADLSTFYSCSFEGYQDTLYTHSLRQFYRECDIYGTVDFIFGNAAVVFQNCNIYPRLPIYGQSNTITAQGRSDPNQNTGTSIQGCTFRPSAELATSSAGGSTRTYLGRPWKLYSRTVVMQSYMDRFINPAGWVPWNGTFALDTLYYAEFNNTGPGSNTTRRVTWPGYHVINSTDAANFTVANFLLADNWLPDSGVPYYSGLL